MRFSGFSGSRNRCSGGAEAAGGENGRGENGTVGQTAFR